MFQQITILGPGLLGASIALAAKSRGLTRHIATWSRRSETRAACKQTKWCDQVFDSPEEAVSNADLVVICTPVETIPPLLRVISGQLKNGSLITDVGSTKGKICDSAPETIPSTSHFVGSHPMAGSEQTGMAHARADLFEKATCFVTPTPDTPDEPVQQVIQFWEAIGMTVQQAQPAEHDAIVAHISHLPHLIASTLCNNLAKKPKSWPKASGNGLRDTTRIASGEAELWRQILEENRASVLEAIEGFKNDLAEIESLLLSRDSDSLRDFLDEGKKFRDKLKPNHSK